MGNASSYFPLDYMDGDCMLLLMTHCKCKKAHVISGGKCGVKFRMI